MIFWKQAKLGMWVGNSPFCDEGNGNNTVSSNAKMLWYDPKVQTQ